MLKTDETLHLVSLEEVIAALEIAYHPQDPIADHPADFIARHFGETTEDDDDRHH